MLDATDKFKHCNHHHKLTDDYCVVDFGDGEFVANRDAVLLLQELNRHGLRTRTHHIDGEGGFVSVLLDDNVCVEVKTVNERDATRTKYNGQKELLISWRKNQ